MKAASDTDEKKGMSSNRKTDSSSDEFGLLKLFSEGPCVFSHQNAELSLEKMESFFLNGQLTDIVLIAGERRIPAHRLVLSAGSEYFAAMFTSNLKEASQTEIEIHNIDGDVLWKLMHYCYTGRIELNTCIVEAVLEAATMLQLTKVVKDCCMYLQEKLAPSNCIGIRFFADSHSFIDLVQASENYTAEHFVEVIQNQEFLMLSEVEVAKLLASDDVNVPSEETIFQALVSWLEYDLPKRAEHVSNLLSLVRLPLLSPSFIVDHIETKPLFRNNSECCILLLEALKYHLLPERRWMLQSPRIFPRKSTTGDLYALGGRGPCKGQLCIEKYDFRLDKWTIYDEITFNEFRCGVALDGKIYLAGGRQALVSLNSVLCYDVKNKTVTELPPMATPRHSLGVAVLNGLLYVIGGHDGWTFVNTVERWDPFSNKWAFVAPMECRRSDFGVGVLNGKLYVVGGRNTLNSVECYDPKINRWQFCSSMNKGRRGMGVGALNGFLYVLGGQGESDDEVTLYSCVERYDPCTDSWTLIASLSCSRESIGVCEMGGKLFAVGGDNKKCCLSTVEVYDPQKNEWQLAAPLNTARASASLVVIKAGKGESSERHHALPCV